MAVDPWQKYNCHTSHRIWICAVVVGMRFFSLSFLSVRSNTLIHFSSSKSQSNPSVYFFLWLQLRRIHFGVWYSALVQDSYRLTYEFYRDCSGYCVYVMISTNLFFISFRNSCYDRQNASTRHKYISMHILIKFQHEIEFEIGKHTDGYTRLASTTYHLTYVYFFISPFIHMNARTQFIET